MDTPAYKIAVSRCIHGGPRKARRYSYVIENFVL